MHSHCYCSLFYVANDISPLCCNIFWKSANWMSRGETMIDHWAAVNRFVRHRNIRCRQLCPSTWRRQQIGGHGLIHHAPDAGQRIINGRDAILHEYLKRWAEYSFELHVTLNHVGPQASPIQIPALKQMLHAWVIFTPVNSFWIYYREEYKFKRPSCSGANRGKYKWRCISYLIFQNNSKKREMQTINDQLVTVRWDNYVLKLFLLTVLFQYFNVTFF